MAIHRLRARQIVPVLLDEAWEFFSNPMNLRRITPPWLDFWPTSVPPERMYPGLMITYQVRPMFGIPLSWATVISQVEENRRFIDEQHIGPYSLWHHQHDFFEVEGGTEVRDAVTYSLPAGPFGDIIARRLVRPRLLEIFNYRRLAVRRRLGPPPGVEHVSRPDTEGDEIFHLFMALKHARHAAAHVGADAGHGGGDDGRAQGHGSERE